jgi:hypothetical protein
MLLTSYILLLSPFLALAARGTVVKRNALDDPEYTRKQCKFEGNNVRNRRCKKSM